MLLTRRDRSALARICAAALSLCCSPFFAAPALSDCPSGGSERVRVTSVEDRLVLRLDDGRLIRLVGLDPPLGTPGAPDLADEAREKLSRVLNGRSLGLLSLGAQPDRWGRVPGMMFVAGSASDAPAASLAATLIAQGLGRYLSEPAAHACRDMLLSAEGTARQRRLGLWNDPYYAVLAVTDHAAFAERSGTLVLAQGKLIAVQPSPYRTTLRFSSPEGGASSEASYGGRMLVATIPPRIMKSFVAQSIDLNGLIGHSLRFRGLLDLRFGPQVELASPDDIEMPGQVP